jgi:hypothetical protein
MCRQGVYAEALQALWEPHESAVSGCTLVGALQHVAVSPQLISSTACTAVNTHLLDPPCYHALAYKVFTPRPHPDPAMRCIRVQVGPICAAVQKDGDKAVKSYTSKFDKVELDEIVVKLAVRVPLCTR